MKTFFKLILFIVLGAAIYVFAFYQTPEQREFKKTLAAAQQGDVSAQLRTGDFYLQGLGVQASQEQALEWYRKALQAGDSSAAWKLAQAYLKAENLEEAATYLQLAAQENNPQAQFELGNFYQQGLGGLPMHAGQALYAWMQAADGNLPQAQEKLKDIQLQNPDLYAAEENFLSELKKAQQGDPSAMLAVGKAYQAGVVVLPDYQQAQKWFSSVWQETKDPQAGYELAQLYLIKNDPISNEEKGISLLGELAELRYAPAQYTLGERSYQENPPNYKDAFAWFSNAAAAGYAPAQYMTGFMLMQGQGMTKSVPLSIQFFKQAAEQEYASAQYVLGQIYYKGLGVPPNQKTGKEWLERAAQNGSVPAQSFLETISKN